MVLEVVAAPKISNLTKVDPNGAKDSTTEGKRRTVHPVSVAVSTWVKSTDVAFETLQRIDEAPGQLAGIPGHARRIGFDVRAPLLQAGLKFGVNEFEVVFLRACDPLSRYFKIPNCGSHWSASQSIITSTISWGEERILAGSEMGSIGGGKFGARRIAYICPQRSRFVAAARAK